MKSAFNGGGGGGIRWGAAVFDSGGDGLQIGNVEAEMGIDNSGGGWLNV